MEAIWIAVALIVAVAGGWPVTAGILVLAKSKPVLAIDAAESMESPAPTPISELPPAAGTEMTSEVQMSTVEETPGRTGTTPEEGSGSGPPATGEVLRGGLLIGFLERAAVTVAILSGQPVAIAYVVAIKGLGRYPELKNTPGASERFIIGTLASMLWAASVAVLVKTLLHIG